MEALSRAEATFWTVWNYVTGAVSRFLREESNNTISNDPNSHQESEHKFDGKPQQDESNKPESNVSNSDTLAASEGHNAKPRESLQQQTPLAGSDATYVFNEVEASQASLSAPPESVDAGVRATDCKRVKLDVCKDKRSKEPEKTTSTTIKNDEASLWAEEANESNPESDADKDSEVEQNTKPLTTNLEVKESLVTLCRDSDDEGKKLESSEEKGNEEAAYQKEEASRLIANEDSKLVIDEEELRTETPKMGLTPQAVTEQGEEVGVLQLQSATVLKTSVDFDGNSNEVNDRPCDSIPGVLLEVSKVEEGGANKENVCTIMTIPVKPAGEPGQEIAPEIENTPTGLSEGHLTESQELNVAAYEETLPEYNNECVLNENTAQWFLEAGDDGKEIQLPEEVENNQNSINIRGVHRADALFDPLDESKNTSDVSVHTGIIAACDTVQEASEILSGPKRTTIELFEEQSASPEHILDTFEKCHANEAVREEDDEEPSMKSEQNSSGASSLQDMTEFEFLLEPQPKCRTEDVVDVQDAGIDMEEINYAYYEEAAEDKRNKRFMDAAQLQSEGEAELLPNTELSTSPKLEASDLHESNNQLSKDFKDSKGIHCMDEKAKLHYDSSTCEETCATKLDHQDLTDQEIEDLWRCAALTEEPEKDTKVMQSTEEGNEIQFEGETIVSISDAEGSSATSQLCPQDSVAKEAVHSISTGSREASFEDGLQTCQLSKTNSLERTSAKIDTGSSAHVPEMSPQQEQDEHQKTFESALEVDGVALDFVAQKCRIAVKNPNVRPPKDPRSLINMPSVTPLSAEHLPGKSIPIGGMALKIKLPGLRDGFQGLKTTKRAVPDDTTDSVSQGTLKEEKGSDAKKREAQHPPKWMPPRQSGFGNPLMSELKSKLKKTTDD